MTELWSQSETDHDRGASAIVIAICMVVLLGFAAIAVDATGLGFNERRQDQSASDVGALAAVQSAVTTDLGNGCSGTNSQIAQCNGAHEAIEVANATLDDPTLADWTDAAVCGTAPAGYTTTAVSPCVAFNSNLQRAWVRVPTITNDTNLAAPLGFDSISTSADAIAGTEFHPPGGILPFLVPGNAAGADYNCLRAGANPDWGPCEDLPTIGNFGSADFFLYGNSQLGYTEKCTGDTNGRLVANIARGVDHPLGIYVPGVTPEIHEAANCPIFSAQPNTVNSETGIGSNLEDGLAYGASDYTSPTTSYPGAIEDTSATNLVRAAGAGNDPIYLDDIPLWTHLKSGLPGPFCNSVSSPQDMEDCINWAKNTSPDPTVIFTDALADAKRFGWVPQLLEADFTGDPYHIIGYRPVYLDTTFFKCDANKCRIMHTPGVSDSGSCPDNPPDTRISCGIGGAGGNGLDAVTSWILSQGIVPDNAKTPPPGSPNQREYNLID